MSQGGWYGDSIVTVVHWLRDHPGEHSGPEIARATDLNLQSIGKFVRRAYHYGWIDNPRRGMYCANDRSEEVRFDEQV